MKQRKKSFQIFTICLVLFFLLPHYLYSQKVDLTRETYIEPPKEIKDVVTAPRHLNLTLRNLSPDGKQFIIPRRAGLPSLEIYAKPYLNLGEIEFDYLANRSRQFTLRRELGFDIFNWETGTRIPVRPPENRWTSNPTWSPDGTKIAFFVHSDEETHIYVANSRNGRFRKITRTPVLASMVTSFEWTQNSQNILTVLVPEHRAPEPRKSTMATEPEVRLTHDGKTPNRTFPNLMQTPHDKKMLEWLTTGQMALINVANRKARLIGKPAMYTQVNISPDGQYIRATIMKKPFAYTVPVRSFGRVENIYDLNGKIMAKVQEQKIRYSTMRPVGKRQREAGANNKRNIMWRPDGKGLSYLQLEPRKKKTQNQEQETGENTGEQPKQKDRVIQWLPPFDSTRIHVIYESKTRINNVYYSQDCQTLFLTQTENGKRHLFAVDLKDTSKKNTIYKYRTNDIYHEPGALLMKQGKLGGLVVRMTPDGGHVYLAGTRYHKDAMNNPPIQFIHKINIKNGKIDTLFVGESTVYEAILSRRERLFFRGGMRTTLVPVADDELKVIFTTRESPVMVPDTYARNLKTGNVKKLTANKDYSPEITRAKRLRFQVERVDGIRFWVQLTLPPDYKSGTPLPAMFWFYPREYTDQKAYDRSAARYNTNAFPRVNPRSMEILTRLGYAVVRPDCPIIGPQGKMNNNYVPDLRNNLWAVIDSLDKKGYIDRDRLGIGGHSYGAFGTANAMIHTPFFKAGIAGDGNYNRTLTPLTFQNERRFLWDAREVYINMSPLLWANQLNGALLMYHGMDDNNVGTFLINSKRMFHVLDGLGKTAALYIYPYEHHGPATRETLLDLWARWIQWLDKYVKNPGKAGEEKRKKQKETMG